MAIQPEGIREVPISDLTRFPGNARRGNVPEIRKSVARLGQYRAIVVRDTGTDLVILAGNHTADALEAEGHETARCEVITCTDDEARRVNVSDNRLSDIAADDQDQLAELLAALDGDYDGTGWTESEAARIISLDLPPGFPEYDESAGIGGIGGGGSSGIPLTVACPECGHVFDAKAVTAHD